MNDKQQALWHKRKQLGRSKYLLLYGILPASIGLTLLFGIIERISQGATYWGWIPVRLLLFAVIGFFIANARWQSMEQRFEQQPRRK